MKHPRDMGPREVEAFLTMLATERKVSASTNNQALSAILFLCREVLAIKLPWLDDIGRPSQKRRIPSVMTRGEVAGLLAQMEGETALLARLLYRPIHRPPWREQSTGRQNLSQPSRFDRAPTLAC